MSSWAAHFVVIGTGFIMPRIISDTLGQRNLGLWDFCWSSLVYLDLLALGVAPAVMYHVARHETEEDAHTLNEKVSTAFLLLAVLGGAATLLAVGLAFSVQYLLRADDPDYVREATHLLLILGVTAGVKIGLLLYNGVITGCRRYDLLNLVFGIQQAVAACLMIGIVLVGGRLVHLACVILGTEVVSGLVRRRVAYRLLPRMQLSLRRVTRGALREIFWFGGKLLVGRLANILWYQTTNVLVMVFLGAASLAVYARCSALILHSRKLLNLFGRVMSPEASVLLGRNRYDELARLLTRSTTAGMMLGLPIVWTLVVMGDIILKVWMGPEYAAWGVVIILAIGHLANLAFTPASCILTGLNRHGARAVGSLVAAVVGTILTVLLVGVAGWELAGAAIAVAVPMSLLDSLLVPVLSVRAVGMRYWDLLGKSAPGPILWTLPYGACLIAARLLFSVPIVALLAGLAAGGSILAAIYWFRAPADIFREPLSRMMSVKWMRRPMKKQAGDTG